MLGDLITVKHGWAFKSQHFEDEGQYVVVTPGNFFEKGGFKLRPGKDRSYSGQFSADYILNESDLIVAMTEQGPGLLGSTALIPESGRFLHNQRIGLISIKDGTRACLKYLYHLFNTAPVRGQLSGSATGTKVRHTAPERIYRVNALVPDLPTQERIAGVLSAYDDLIENNRRRIALLEQAARLLYREWFVHFRFPGHETTKFIDGLPEGWGLTSIRETYIGLFDGPHATPKPSEEGPVFLGIKNIREGGGVDLSEIRHVSEDEFPKWTRRVTPEKGDIVFSYEATLHRYALIPAELRCCLGRRMALIRPKDDYRYYLYLQMFSERWREVISARTLVGATVNRIPLKTFPDFPILLPPRDLTVSFNALVEPVFLMIERLNEQNTKLAKARDLLLPRLMDGRISV
nr:restriction endonuclease subunit S [uncultured Cohaesibacter sp.]